MRKLRGVWVVAMVAVMHSGVAAAQQPYLEEEMDEPPGKGGIDVMMGVPVLMHRFARNGVAAHDTTVVDSLRLVQQLGLSYTAADVLQIGFAAQFAEVITNPDPALNSRLTDVRLIPSVTFRFEPFSLGLGALFSVRQDGINGFGFGLLPTIAARMPISGGLSLILQVQAPVFVHPTLTVGIQPLLGISYEETSR